MKIFVLKLLLIFEIYSFAGGTQTFGFGGARNKKNWNANREVGGSVDRAALHSRTVEILH